MRTLIVGDVHLKASAILADVDDVLSVHPEVQRIVFTGDICDEWNAGEALMMRELEEFADWVEERRDEGYEVDVLFGNHDFQYLLGKQGPGTIMDLIPFVRETLFPLGLRAAVTVDGFLVTHAGLTQSWADEHLDCPESAEEAAEQLNEMLDGRDYHDLQALFTCGPDRGGRGIPGPLWADRYELQEDPVEEMGQIVGHSPVDTACCSEGSGWVPDAAPELWFCDTFSLFSDGRPIGDGTMLLVEDGVVEVVEA